MNHLHDKELEGKVLGAVIFDWQIWHEISEIFNPDLFVNPDYHRIAKVVVELRNNGQVSDLQSVVMEMKARDYFTDSFGAYHLSQLTSDVAAVANTATHVFYLQELYMKREVMRLAQKTIQGVTAYNSDIFDIIDEYEKGLTQLTNKVITSKTYTPDELFKEALRVNEKIVKMNGNLSGITSGFRVIDEITGGWQASDLIVLGADAGMGKTSLALEFAKRPALQGIPVAFFSLEMGLRPLFARMISQESDMELNKILRTGMTEWDVKNVTERTEALRKAPIFFEDEKMNIFELKNRARKLKRKHNIKLLIIDYLQLIETTGINNRAEAVSYVSRSLKGLAKELNIPIITISSLLNKEISKRPGKVPQKSDLRESGNIEFDADLICLLYRPEYYEIFEDDQGNSTAGKCIFMIEKHRNGALSRPVLGFEGRLTKFYSIGVDDLMTKIEPNYEFGTSV